MANVVIKRHVAAFNIDTYNRSVIASTDLENGTVFTLNAKDANEKLCWTPTAPGANGTGLWMATSPAVVYVNKTQGLTVDPRDFVNKAGKVIDATFLAVGDLIEMTGEGISGIDTNNFLAPDAGKFVLKAVNEAPATGCYLKKVDTSVLHIGDGAIAPTAVPTYIFEVKAN